MKESEIRPEKIFDEYLRLTKNDTKTYFSDSEKGASKFKEITAQLGVVVGNVTDIISDLGKSVFKLITGDFDGFNPSDPAAEPQSRSGLSRW